MPRWIFALVLSLNLLSTTYAQDDFQEAMLDSMASQGIDGVVIVVVDGDEVIYLAGLGNDADGGPIDPATAYDIGRLSDPIVSLLAFSQAERNLLAPEINVRNLLPAGTIPESLNGVTIARLMNHSASLGEADLAPLEPLPFSVLPGVALTTFPGERFSYCTRCYGLLVTVLETIGGQELDVQLEQSIFYPLMMDDTRVVDGHILSTPRDLAKIMSLHIQNGRWSGVQLVRPDTIQALHRAAIMTGRDSREFAGYGWFVLTDAGIDSPDPLLNYTATALDIGGYRAQMTLIPGLGRGVLLMTDQDTNGLEALTAITLEAFTGWTAPAPPPTRNLSLLEGNFRPRDSGDWIAVVAENDELQISLGEKTTLATFSDTRAVTFPVEGRRASLFFPETGLAREAILTVDGITAVYQRVFD